MSSFALLPGPAELRLDHLLSDAQSITIVITTARSAAPCPACHRPSTRVHSRYTRLLADLPWNGMAVRLRLHTRRFFCSSMTCSRRIFTERLPATAAPYARRTRRLNEALQMLAFVIGGEPGARVAGQLGMTVSGDTLLRRIRQSVSTELPTPRVLGVDDWAWRKGHRYGTILVDLERHRVVDLLLDREAASLEHWLQAHPGVEVISRDRSHAYAEGAAKGAPEAVQVADRWHLLKNLGEALERILQSKHSQLHQAAQRTAEPIAVVAAPEVSVPQEAAAAPKPLSQAQQQKRRSRERRLARYEQVIALHQQGWSQRAISHQTGLERKTVRRYLRAGVFREWATPQRHRALDGFLPYLERRWTEGCHNAAQLWREIKQQGYRGRPGMIRQWAIPRRDKKRGEQSLTATPQKRKQVPTPREAVWWLLQPEERSAEERRFVEALCEHAPEIRQAAEVGREFTRLVRERDVTAWPGWQKAAACTLLAPFAQQLQRDGAVQAALTHIWSNGQTEGQVHRLKLIKRQMFGRAKFDLLKKRVLYKAA